MRERSKEYWILMFKKIENFLSKNFNKNMPNPLFDEYFKQILNIQNMLNFEQGFFLIYKKKIFSLFK